MHMKTQPPWACAEEVLIMVPIQRLKHFLQISQSTLLQPYLYLLLHHKLHTSLCDLTHHYQWPAHRQWKVCCRHHLSDKDNMNPFGQETSNNLQTMLLHHLIFHCPQTNQTLHWSWCFQHIPYNMASMNQALHQVNCLDSRHNNWREVS